MGDPDIKNLSPRSKHILQKYYGDTTAGIIRLSYEKFYRREPLSKSYEFPYGIKINQRKSEKSEKSNKLRSSEVAKSSGGNAPPRVIVGKSAVKRYLKKFSGHGRPEILNKNTSEKISDISTDRKTESRSSAVRNILNSAKLKLGCAQNGLIVDNELHAKSPQTERGSSYFSPNKSHRRLLTHTLDDSHAVPVAIANDSSPRRVCINTTYSTVTYLPTASVSSISTSPTMSCHMPMRPSHTPVPPAEGMRQHLVSTARGNLTFSGLDRQLNHHTELESPLPNRLDVVFRQNTMSSEECRRNSLASAAPSGDQRNGQMARHVQQVDGTVGSPDRLHLHDAGAPVEGSRLQHVDFSSEAYFWSYSRGWMELDHLRFLDNPDEGGGVGDTKIGEDRTGARGEHEPWRGRSELDPESDRDSEVPMLDISSSKPGSLFHRRGAQPRTKCKSVDWSTSTFSSNVDKANQEGQGQGLKSRAGLETSGGAESVPENRRIRSHDAPLDSGVVRNQSEDVDEDEDERKDVVYETLSSPRGVSPYHFSPRGSGAFSRFNFLSDDKGLEKGSPGASSHSLLTYKALSAHDLASASSRSAGGPYPFSPLARAPEFPGGLGLDDYDITRQMSALSLSSTATSVISSSSASSIAERVERLQADIESLYEQRDEAMRTQSAVKRSIGEWMATFENAEAKRFPSREEKKSLEEMYLALRKATAGVFRINSQISKKDKQLFRRKRYLREVLRDGAADEDVEAVAKEEAPRKRSVSSASADKGKIKSRRSEAQLETVQDGIENVPRKKSLTSDTSSTRRRKSQNQILDVPVSSSSIILRKFLELFAAFMNRVADEEEQRLLREMEFIERAKKLQAVVRAYHLPKRVRVHINTAEEIQAFVASALHTWLLFELETTAEESVNLRHYVDSLRDTAQGQLVRFDDQSTVEDRERERDTASRSIYGNNKPRQDITRQDPVVPFEEYLSLVDFNDPDFSHGPDLERLRENQEKNRSLRSEKGLSAGGGANRKYSLKSTEVESMLTTAFQELIHLNHLYRRKRDCFSLQENLREELFSLEDPKHCYNKTGVDAENEENEVNLLYEQLYEVKLKRSSLNLITNRLHDFREELLQRAVSVGLRTRDLKQMMPTPFALLGKGLDGGRNHRRVSSALV